MLISGILTPLSSFRCDGETGILPEKTFPGDCERGPQKFQSDINRHRIETQNQAVLAAGASKKAEMGFRY